jgi:hypothetical protein
VLAEVLTLKYAYYSVQFLLNVRTFVSLLANWQRKHLRCASKSQQMMQTYICAAKCNVIIWSRHANHQVIVINRAHNLLEAKFQQRCTPQHHFSHCLVAFIHVHFVFMPIPGAYTRRLSGLKSSDEYKVRINVIILDDQQSLH